MEYVMSQRDNTTFMKDLHWWGSRSVCWCGLTLGVFCIFRWLIPSLLRSVAPSVSSVCVPELFPILCPFAPVFVPPSSPQSNLFFPFYLETSAWIRQPSPALPPCSTLLLFILPCSLWLPVQPSFLGSFKKARSPPSPSYISISTYGLLFVFLFT